MIAKIVPAPKGRADIGRLARYITDQKNKAAQHTEPGAAGGQQLVEYIIDAGHEGDKVEWYRVSNCGAEDPMLASKEMAATQKQNTRVKDDTKTVHIVVSFPEGERPTDAQIHDIEDTLCAALGMGDHQRISALHINTDNVHLHIALNRIHPEKLTANEMKFSKRKLMAACERLEKKHQLRHDNHGLDGESINQAAGTLSFADWVKEKVGPELVALVAEGATWEKVHATAAKFGLVIRQQGTGLVIADMADDKQTVKASAVDRSLSMKGMSTAIGPYEPPPEQSVQPETTWRQETGIVVEIREEGGEETAPALDIEIQGGRQSFADWVKEKAASDLVAAIASGGTWEAVHEVASRYGLLIKPRGAGLVIVDAADDKRVVKASTVDRRLSSKAMTAALGIYAPPAAQAARPETTWEEDTATTIEPPAPPPFTEADLEAVAVDERAAAIEAHPEVIFTALNKHAATWREGDIRREVRTHLRQLDPAERLAAEDHLVASLLKSPLLIEGGKDKQGHMRYSTATFVALEQHMIARAEVMAGRAEEGIAPDQADAAIAAFEVAARVRLSDEHFQLNDEQRAAVHHLVAPGALKLVLGQAGTGKSTLLDAARLAWEGQGQTVLGAALSGIAAENLETCGIKSRTIASLLASLERRDRLHQFAETGILTEDIRADLLAHVDAAIEAGSQWAVPVRAELEAGMLSDRSLDWAIQWAERRLARSPGLTSKTVLVLDEAGMVPSRQMAELIRRVDEADAKLVLVGDHQQLQPIEAGAPFRIMAERFGCAELTDVRRQQEAWQRIATSQLATGRVEEAVKAYAANGNVHAGIDMDEAGFIKTLEGRLSRTLDEADRARVVTVARYAEARNAAGALWSVIGQDKQPNKHDWYGDFEEWKGQREDMATLIAADLDQFKPWLAQFAISGEGLASDILAANGTTRSEAMERAAEEALRLGIFEIEQTLPEETRLRADFRSGAKAALVVDWAAAIDADPTASRIILAHAGADVDDMNALAKALARSAGRVTGPDHIIATKDGPRAFAAGDRILFLENSKTVGVKNGTTGTIDVIDSEEGRAPLLGVRLDDGRNITIDTGTYANIDLGYAVTVHKAQGVSVDETYFLATVGVDAHLAYVGMSRHRQLLRVYAAAGDAAKPEIFAKSAAVANSQDTTLDYRFAAQPAPEVTERAGPLKRSPSHPSRRPKLPDDSRTTSLAENPEAIFDTLNVHAATWTEADMLREVRRHLYHLPKDARADAANRLVAGLLKSPLLVVTHAPEGDAKEAAPPRYSTVAFAALEQRMMASATGMAGRVDLGIDPVRAEAAITAFEAAARSQHGNPDFKLNREQRAAVHHIVAPGALKLVLGQAGTGKSTLLEAARLAWEEAEQTVIGATLSGIAAENLQKSGIQSRTIASLLLALDRRDQLQEFVETGVMTEEIREALTDYADWKIANGKPEAVAFAKFAKQELDADRLSPATVQWAIDWAERRLDRMPNLTPTTVLVVDEAGMVASRQMAELVRRVDEAGAKMVLVGDHQQLQPIEAGAAFRAMADRFGYAELTDIRRQHEEWQRQATSALAHGQVAAAVTAYANRGCVTAGVDMDESVLIGRLETRLGSRLDEADRARVVTITRYAEARNAAGAIWGLIGGKDASEHEWYPDFQHWKGQREAMASEIRSNIEGFKPWLARFGVNGEGLAADMLAASGRRRDEAVEEAELEAKALGIFEIEQLLPEEDRLKADFRAGAKATLVAAWAEVVAANPSATRIILAHSRADVEDMNAMARQVARDTGRLIGDDHLVSTAQGDRAFAAGDRILFLENNKGLGVKNGTTGTIQAIEAPDGAAAKLTVMLDDGRAVVVDTADYNQFDLGYAVTVHKSQGVTVDDTFFLATTGVDAHLAYVGMSRHRANLRTFAAAGDAAKPEIFAKSAEKANSQDSTLDHNFPTVQQPAEQKTHAPAQPRERYRAGSKHSHPKSPSLFKLYQAERADHLGAREAKISALRDAHDRFRGDLARWYHGEKERANRLVAKLFGRPKKMMFEANKIRSERLQQSFVDLRTGIAAIKAEHPLPTWQEWLQQRAEQGDVDALSILRTTAARRHAAAQSITAAGTADEALAVVLKGHRVKARHDGRLIYTTEDGGCITDHADSIAITTESRGGAILAAQLASERHPGQELSINASEEFRQWMAEHAGKANLPIRFADKADEAFRAQYAAMRNPAEPQVEGRTTLLTHRDWTPGLAGEYTFNGISRRDGSAVLLWQQGSTVYVQPSTEQALAAVKDIKQGATVTFDTSGTPKPKVQKQGRGH